MTRHTQHNLEIWSKRQPKDNDWLERCWGTQEPCQFAALFTSIQIEINSKTWLDGN